MVCWVCVFLQGEDTKVDGVEVIEGIGLEEKGGCLVHSVRLTSQVRLRSRGRNWECRSDKGRGVWIMYREYHLIYPPQPF